MIAYLLDTNCCIYLLARNKPALSLRIEHCARDTVGISAIVAAELMLGFGKAAAHERDRLAAFFLLFPILPFDEQAAQAYASVPFRRGKLDRLIAAHAIAVGATLVTNNVRDFSDVPNLVLEDWTVSGA